MTDVSSRVGVEFTATGDAQVIKSLNEVAASGTTAETSLKGVTAAHTRLAEEARKATGSSKAMQQATLGLSRQFTDIGVQLAGGQNPFLVLTQQLPQIADQFAVSKQQGLGFKDVLRGIGGSLAPVAPLLLGVGAAVGVAAVGFGLFERAVDKQTKYATTFGDTWKATLTVVGDMIMDGPIGDGLRALGALFDKTLSAITSGAVTYIARFVGFWGSAYNAIVNNWRNLPAALGAIVQNAVNISLKNIEGFINATIGGLNVLLKKANLSEISKVSLGQVKVFSGKIADEIAADQKRIEAQTLKSLSDFTKKVAAEADKNYLARQKAKKGSKEHADAVDKEAKALANLRREVESLLQSLESPYEKALREGNEATLLLRKALDAGVITTDQFREAIDRLFKPVVTAADAVKALNAQFENTPEDAAKGIKSLDTAADKVRDLADAFADAQFSFEDLLGSMKSGNIGRFLGNIQGLISSIPQLLAQGPGGIASLGSLAANAIGGRGGRAIGGGLGIAASGIGLGTFAGSTFGGAALTAAGLGGLVGPLIALAGPIGIAAGALYAAAKLFNIGGKPSNKGAGFDLVTGAISGNKRDAETEEAARTAGEAIIGIQDALKAAGIGLTDTVKGLVIGTRDQTQIYLASGKTLLSAVGDSGAAVDTALRALLEGATYVSEAQKKLVDSALAAGKGFDAIQEILAKYEAAQGISASLAEAIQQLTDPKAFDLGQVEKNITAQRDAAKKLADEGYLTADSLATINGQLDTLRGLQIDEVMRRYGAAVDDAAQAALQAANDNAQLAAGALTDAQQNLIDAYGREADALKATSDRFRDLAANLRQFGAALAGGEGGAGGLQFARAAFLRTSALAQGGDVKALGDLQRVSEAYLQAAKAAAPDARAYARDLAAVRNAVEASANVADATASAAEQQLQALHDQVAQLVTLNESVLSVVDAISALATATAANAAAQQALADLQATNAPTTVSAPVTAPLSVDTSALEAKIDALNERLTGLQAENNALTAQIAKTNTTTADTLVRVSRDGESLLTTAA
ncbi:hypothetical protein [Synechococcus phage Ssp-JY42]|nr:hypothetical protein [Synechococcus phage Yong-M4-211]